MPERVEGRLWSLVLAPLYGDGHHDPGVLEDLVYVVVDPAHPVHPARRRRPYLRKHIARPRLYRRLHQQFGERLVDRDRHRTPLAVLLGLLRDLLYYRADDVHLRPCQLAAVSEAHSRVHRDPEQGAPFGSFAGRHVDEAGQLLDCEFPPRMRIVRPQGEPLPGVDLGRGLGHYRAVDLPQDAEAVVVRRGGGLPAEVVEVVLDVVAGYVPHLRHLRKHLRHVVDEYPAYLLLPHHRRRGEVAPHRGRLVCSPCVRELQLRPLGLPHLGKLPLGHHRRLNVLKGACGIVFHIRGEELLGEQLRLRPVLGSRGLRDALSVDDAAERPHPGLLELEPPKPLGAPTAGLLGALLPLPGLSVLASRSRPKTLVGLRGRSHRVCFAGLFYRHGRRLVIWSNATVHVFTSIGRLVYRHGRIIAVLVYRHSLAFGRLYYRHFRSAGCLFHTPGMVFVVSHTALRYLSFPLIAQKKTSEGPIALQTPHIVQYKPV